MLFLFLKSFNSVHQDAFQATISTRINPWLIYLTNTIGVNSNWWFSEIISIIESVVFNSIYTSLFNYQKAWGKKEAKLEFAAALGRNKEN